MENGYDLNHLLQQAKSHWLMPDQLLFILQNHHLMMIQDRVPQTPASGSLFLFNKNNVPSFRKDGHNWRKKPNRNCVTEAHEKLKVGNVEALVCYYAKGADKPTFKRRIYWMIKEKKEIVLVHYLDTAEGVTNSASIMDGSTGQSYSVTPSVMHDYQSLGSPLSVEVNSRDATRRRELFPSVPAAQNVRTSREVDMLSCQMMQELGDQLVQNCNIGEQSSAFGNKEHNIDGIAVIGSDRSVKQLDQCSRIPDLPTWQDIAFLTAPQAENFEACLGRTPCQTQMPLRAAEQKFNISEISPQWCFTDEVTKVIVIGKFNCDASESVYAMFGDIKAEARIMQNGVLWCHAPSNSPGKVSFCITSGNQECCSEVKEFEYRDRNSNYAKLQQQDGRVEEGKLLVEFIEMLSFDSSLQELLEDKLQRWLRTRFEKADHESSCSLSKKERRIIHLAAGLGYDWALKTILDSGVRVDFRDTNGWTALHWAARFGREEMVGALIACGASVSAVTDPTAEDPMGKNAASIAEANGHKGLAAFLSASDLTSQFSDLSIEKEDVIVSSSSGSNEFVDEDESCTKRIVEASRKAAERKQQAFLKREAAAAAAKCGEENEFGLTCEETQLVCAAAFKSRTVATATIQKYYRAWKRRNNFLTKRKQAAIKIQAHERGRRVRKYYRVIRVVRIMEKIILRWRRKSYALRDFRLKGEAMKEEEEEDIFKDFRKKKLDSTLKEALERVRCLVQCREARGQCTRMLQAFRVAKARLGVSTEAPGLLNGIDFGENDAAADIDAFGLLPLQDTPASPDYLTYYRGIFDDDMGDILP